MNDSFTCLHNGVASVSGSRLEASSFLEDACPVQCLRGFQVSEGRLELLCCRRGAFEMGAALV